MFYSIDLDGLRVLHKHPRFDMCGLLATLEAPDCDILITSFSSPGSLLGFTVFELHKLYANTCGVKFAGFDERALRAAIYAVMQALPETDCVPYEVERQCACVGAKDTSAYRYIKGALKPALRTEGLAALTISVPTTAAQYTDDPAIVLESSTPTERRTPVRAPASSSVIVRPVDGVGAEIWTALDQNPHLNDGLAIQVEAKRRGWNTLTAILQLAQWKKFKSQEGE